MGNDRRTRLAWAGIALAAAPVLLLPAVDAHYEIVLSRGVERHTSTVVETPRGHSTQIRSWREGRRAIRYGPFAIASALLLGAALALFPRPASAAGLQVRLSGVALAVGALLVGLVMTGPPDNSFFGDFRILIIAGVGIWVGFHLLLTWAALPLLRWRTGWLRGLHVALLSVAAAFAVWLRLK